MNFASAVGVAFGLLFQTVVEPDLVHTKLVADCLNVAPAGEHASPFLIGAAQVVVTIDCEPNTKRVMTAVLSKFLP